MKKQEKSIGCYDGYPISSIGIAQRLFFGPEQYGKTCLISQHTQGVPENIHRNGSDENIFLIPGIGGTVREYSEQVLASMAGDSNLDFSRELPARTIFGKSIPLKNTVSPNEAAKSIADEIIQITNQTAEPLIAIAHSLGGASLEEALCILKKQKSIECIKHVIEIAPMHGAIQPKGILSKTLFGEIANYVSGPRPKERAEEILSFGIPIDFHVLHQHEKDVLQEGTEDTDGVLPAVIQAPPLSLLTKDVHNRFDHYGTRHLDLLSNPEVIKTIYNASLTP